MPVFNSDNGMEIPGLNTEAYTASADHFSFLSKFGRTYYEAGVEAGLAQANVDTGVRPAVALTPKPEDSQDLIASIVARNEELESKVKELEGKDEEIESFKKAVSDAQEGLEDAHAAMVSVLKSVAHTVHSGLFQRLTNVTSEIGERRNECAELIQRADRKSKKRGNESQGARGSSSKHGKHN